MEKPPLLETFKEGKVTGSGKGLVTTLFICYYLDLISSGHGAAW